MKTLNGRPNDRNKAQCVFVTVRIRPNRRDKSAFSWRITVKGRANRRNKAAFSWQITVNSRTNRRNKAAFSWRISMNGRPNRRSKAAFLWRISVDGRTNRINSCLNSSGIVWTLPEKFLWVTITGLFLSICHTASKFPPCSGIEVRRWRFKSCPSISPRTYPVKLKIITGQ